MKINNEYRFLVYFFYKLTHVSELDYEMALSHGYGLFTGV